jgi:hypothetical protein
MMSVVDEKLLELKASKYNYKSMWSFIQNAINLDTLWILAKLTGKTTNMSSNGTDFSKNKMQTWLRNTCKRPYATDIIIFYTDGILMGILMAWTQALLRLWGRVAVIETVWKMEQTERRRHDEKGKISSQTKD